jgi:hypothetical protein
MKLNTHFEIWNKFPTLLFLSPIIIYGMTRIINSINIKNHSGGENNVELIKQLDKLGVFKKKQRKVRKSPTMDNLEEMKSVSDMGPGWVKTIAPMFRETAPPVSRQALEDLDRNYANRFALLKEANDTLQAENMATRNYAGFIGQSLSNIQSNRIFDNEPIVEEPYSIPDTTDQDFTQSGTSPDAQRSEDEGIDLVQPAMDVFVDKQEPASYQEYSKSQFAGLFPNGLPPANKSPGAKIFTMLKRYIADNYGEDKLLNRKGNPYTDWKGFRGQALKVIGANPI